MGKKNKEKPLTIEGNNPELMKPESSNVIAKNMSSNESELEDTVRQSIEFYLLDIQSGIIDQMKVHNDRAIEQSEKRIIEAMRSDYYIELMMHQRKEIETTLSRIGKSYQTINELMNKIKGACQVVEQQANKRGIKE